MVDCMLNNPPSPPPPSSSLADTMQLAIDEAKTSVEGKGKNKRKRDKTNKSIEEVEKQRMTHIAVERNRRKQMNEHLQILRSLMPTYYVHRGDQASIVGAAIEFVRELQQLLQCLESVKRHQHHQPQMILPPTLDQTAESKSYLADVEVKLSGLFGLIKILSRRRRGQLIKYIAAVEHLHLHILQTDITTIQQDVVCSFTVKMSREAMLTAEDMANSIQQILNSLHASSSMS
uniref:Basic helix-loop-helix transcription factor n=1 Tax=Salvia miltiorrhiza TaxID=226208 RepID=A0A0H3YC30_SALMI|nr:basic helix-loop-helix transcription factor [Salvia miltiorrhiza]